MSPRHPRSIIDRRELLVGTGAVGLTAIPILACAKQPAAAATSARLIAGTTCPVTPRQTQGPFYFDPRLVRQDLAEGKEGVPLSLRLQIVEASACAPSERARVDLWHCDAGGTYSGYDSERSTGERWLRGTQFADAEGVVTFRTLYPGWYEGRAPHIHVKAVMTDGRELVSQLYFPDALSDQLYAEGAYAGRAGRRLRNEEDWIFRGLDGQAPLAEIARTPQGLAGAIVIALA